jgi:hypothetical protein
VRLGDRPQGSHDITRAGCKGIAGLPPERWTPRGVLSDIITIIITFTRERPEGFRHASPTPREGDCRSRRGRSIALNPAVFPYIGSYLPKVGLFNRNLPHQYQHCERLVRARSRMIL